MFPLTRLSLPPYSPPHRTNMKHFFLTTKFSDNFFFIIVIRLLSTLCWFNFFCISLLFLLS